MYNIKISKKCYKKLEELNISSYITNLKNFKEDRTLNIKKLKGSWKGYFRYKVKNNLRIIFLEIDDKNLLIYKVGFRENVYS